MLKKRRDIPGIELTDLGIEPTLKISNIRSRNIVRKPSDNRLKTQILNADSIIRANHEPENLKLILGRYVWSVE